MNELLTLAILPGAIWLGLVFLRIPAVTMVLSVLAGQLFAQQLSQYLYDLTNNYLSISPDQAKLLLLLLPVVLTVILTRSKVAKTKVLSNALPLLFASASLVLFALPYSGLSDKISPTGQDIISSYQNYMVCATAGLGLLYAWAPNLKRSKDKHR